MLHRALPFVIVLCAPAAHAGTQRCDALPEKWEQTHDKAACYIATDDAAAIPKLLAVAKKASAWRTVEAPAAGANDDDVIWRETFYFAAEGAGKLAAASGSATLVDFARSRDVDTQRFGIRGLAAMLDQLIGDDRARYERERVKVMPICLTKLAASEPRIQSDALALCIAEHADRDARVAATVLDLVVASTDDRVRIAGMAAYRHAAPSDWHDRDRLQRLGTAIAAPLDARWTYDGVTWRDEGCRVLAELREPWAKPFVLHAASEIRQRAGESPSEPCRTAAAALPGSNDLPPPSYGRTAAPPPPVHTGDGIAESPPTDEVAFHEAAPLRFRAAKPRGLVQIATKSERLIYAPNGSDRASYGMSDAHLWSHGKVVALPENNNVLDVSYSADGTRLAFVGATTGLWVRDARTGAKLYDPGRNVDAAAFLHGDGSRLVWFMAPDAAHPEQGQFWTLDAPFTGVPHPVMPQRFLGYGVQFDAAGTRAIVWDDRDDGSLIEVALDTGVATRIAHGVSAPIVFARDASRACYHHSEQQPLVCVHVGDHEHEVVAAGEYAGDAIALSEHGDKLFLTYHGGYAIADFAARSVTPLAGVKGYTGGVLAMNLAGTAIGAGSSSGVHVFDLARKDSYVIAGSALYGVTPVPGRPEALGVHKEVSEGQDLYELIAP